MKINCAGILLAVVLASAALPLMAEESAGNKTSGGYVEPKMTHDNYGPMKLLFPVTSADADVWRAEMQHAANATSTIAKWGGKADIKFVLYGEGVLLMTHQNDAVAALVDKLRANGVQFLLCNNSLRGHDLDFHALHNVADADIVPAGVLEVGWLQMHGFVLDY